MKSVFKATAILGSSSAVTVVVGLVSAKFWAVLMGPAGLGYLAMLQSLLTISVMIVGLGINVGMVRVGAKAIAGDDEATLAAGGKTALILSLIAGVIGLLLLFLLRNVINQAMLGGNGSGSEVALLGIALFFNLLTNVFNAVLNAHQKIKTLAKITVINSVVGASVLLACVWFWHTRGIVIGFIGGALLSCLLTFYFVNRETVAPVVTLTREKLTEMAKTLLRFGFSYTASMIVGVGIQLILPILILHQLDLESVGFFRAATTVSATSLGLVLAAMGQDYFPRLSAISDNPAEMVKTVNEQQYSAIIFVAPIVLWLLFLSPFIVPVVFSAKFVQTSEILNWMLVGDIFKILSWMLAFVILARGKSNVYFFTELTGGVATLAASLLAMQWFGVKGLGIGYLIAYFVYYLVVLFLVRREIKLVYTKQNVALILFTIAGAVAISILSVYAGGYLRNFVALAVCLGAAAISLAALWKHSLPERFRRRRQTLP